MAEIEKINLDGTEYVIKADNVDGYHISVVSTLPETPDANTIYIII